MKILKAAALLTAAACSLSACSSVVNPGGGGDTVTVYSNSLSDGRGEWLKAEAEKQGISVQLVELDGGDLYNRLVAEKANPQADVLIGLNDVYIRKLKNQDVLGKSNPSWADKITDDSADEDGLFWPLIKEPIMLVANDAAPEQPTDWSDLWTKPEFKDKYAVPTTLGGGTNQMVMTSILNRNVDSNGNLGIGQEGWDNLKAFYGNGKPAEQGTDLYASLKNGSVIAGPMWLTGKIAREEQYGIKTHAIDSSVGIPILHQYVSVINGSKKAEQAEKFLEWFGSGEVQGAWSKNFGTAPVNSDALATGNPEIVEFVEGFQAQDLDWDFVAENLDKWVEEATLKYLNQ